MTKTFGTVIGRKIRQRLDDLTAATCLEDMRNLPGRCHELKAERKGQLALCLNENFRLIFTVDNRPVPLNFDGGLNWTAVTSVRMIEVEDYHGE